MRVTAVRIAAVGAILAAATFARAGEITFDDLTNGTLVTNQYASQGITFSSTDGQAIYVTTQPSYESTPPNLICTGPAAGGLLNCAGTVIFTFSTPVDDLQFDAVGNQNAIGSPFAEADIYQNGVLTVENLELLVSQGNYLPDHQDFSEYNDITQVVIFNNTDPAGTGYDTISFTPATSVSSVPEPGTMSLFGMACMGLLVLRKRPS